MAQEKVEFYKCDEVTNASTVSDNGIIVNVNGGIYIGNKTNEPILIANKVEKVSEIENDLNYLNEDAVKTINGTSLVGQGDIKLVNSILSLTYSELVTLRDSSQLMPGQQYRITDYATTTIQQNTQSAGHQFDIIVTADDESTLNEVAKAILHEGDTYFTDSDLNSWQIWYCLDNDTNRFTWADSTNGKGVIYYMKDEWNNECPYDFKNIQFKHPKDTTTYPDYYYTFSTVIDGSVTDHSMLQSSCYCNTMKEYVDYRAKRQVLNNNVFLNVSLTSLCYNNSFGNNCSYNSFGNSCSSNSFGNTCSYNSFGNGCISNSFGNDCISNSFGNSCISNSFGNTCSSNSFGNYCNSNSFGNNCSYNSFGNSCSSNSFGNTCSYNSFGNSASETSKLKDYVQHNHFDDGCVYNVIWNSATTSSSIQLKNINVNRGVSGTRSLYNMINIETLNSEKEININNYNGHIYIDRGDVFNITHDELVNLRDNSQLIPGRQYRIIDYITTTSQENTQSAGHQFDIIVLATSENILSEEAKAMLHEGDTYFSENGANLDAWKLWYCLDNDTDRFAWADSTNGKGVIYYMKDEWNNECPYDFKNIQFKHPKDTTTYPDYYYTFSTVIDGSVTDHSMSQSKCYCNIMKEFVNFRTERQILNNNVFLNDSLTSLCYSNSFGNSCYSNSFGNNCNSNSFGNDCYNNSFGNSCNSNSFGNGCSNNSFGNRCNSNSFGNDCYNNSFGNNCNYNSFGNECYYNSFGNSCNYNSFGNNCNYNSFGNDCYSNSFGNCCNSNSFRVSADTSSTLKNYVKYNHFDDGCSYNVIWNSDTTSSSIQLKNINVNRGVSGTRSLYNYININTINSEQEINVDNINGYTYVFEGTEKIYKTTYNNLVSLRNNLQLIPGTWYRITDYITTTVQENTQSAGHQFDVLVLATSENTLSEEAKAMLHEGDTYFSENGANLDVWEIKYVLDNDAERFTWADTTNGKGVIYYMKDEWNNECPYDFKNIQFKHPKDTTTYPDYYYTFSTVIDGSVTDHSMSQSKCYCNIMKECVNYRTEKQELNNNVFLNVSLTSLCYSNSFGNYCNSNSFGNDCISNSFGNGCNGNSFGNNCYNNSFGNGCNGNSFGNDCYYNSFGNYCYVDSFGNSCTNNSFGNRCNNNSFGNSCTNNSFGNSCTNISFGNNCTNNSFGNDCYNSLFGNGCYSNSFGNGCNSNSFGGNFSYNSFGNSCTNNSFRLRATQSSSLKNYVQYNHFDDGCSYNVIWNSATTSSSIQLKNININRGVCGTSGSYNLINIETLNQNYEIQVAKNSMGEIKIYCEADLIV